MKPQGVIIAVMMLWLGVAPASANWLGKSGDDNPVSIPNRGGAPVVIDNAAVFQPWVQRLLAEGELKHARVIEPRPIALPIICCRGFSATPQPCYIIEILPR
jgi:hypothetical protein